MNGTLILCEPLAVYEAAERVACSEREYLVERYLTAIRIYREDTPMQPDMFGQARNNLRQHIREHCCRQ